MRGALLKKRYGIPAALLIALILSGAVFAWYGFTTIKSVSTVQESLSTKNKTKSFSTICPDENENWSFDIVNSADVKYTIKADLTYSAPDGVTITTFTVGGTDMTSDLKDDGSVTFHIVPNETLSCSMKIKAAKDAAPGDVSVTLDLYRE